MRPEVRDAFLPFSERFEGSTDWFYCDVKGLVTIGIGNLVDPLPLANGLVFTRPDGSIASASEVSSAWLQVKNRQDLRLRGGGAYKPLTTIRATKASIQALCASKLAQFETVIRTYFADYDAWPADAQLGVLSMSWAAGPHCFQGFPRFVQAARDARWADAAAECHLGDAGNPGLRPRNIANEMLFRAAAGAKSSPSDDDRYIELADVMVKPHNR